MRKIIFLISAVAVVGIAALFLLQNFSSSLTGPSSPLAVIVQDKITGKPISNAIVEIKEGISCLPDLRECPEGYTVAKKTNADGSADFSNESGKFRELAKKNSVIITATAEDYLEGKIYQDKWVIEERILIELVGGPSVKVKTEEEALSLVMDDPFVVEWRNGRTDIHEEVYNLPTDALIWTVNLSDQGATQCTTMNPCAIYFNVDMQTGAVTNVTRK